MSKTERIDVLVIGLGPAGSRAAAEAATEGARVVALDRRRKPGFPVQCAEFVPALLDQELDGLDAVTRQRIVDMVTYIEGEAPHLKPEFPGRMIDRAAFDAALVERARDAGADCRFGHMVAAIGDDGRVTLTTGETLKARVLVGADGPRSRVGRALGRINRDIVETRQITVPLPTPHGATDIFLSADIKGGYGWLFPKGDVANVGAGVVPGARASLKAIVEDLHRTLVSEGRVGAGVLGTTGGAIPVGGLLEPFGYLSETAVLLAGDAAGLANPVTGAGISAAVLSGALAGDAAGAILAGDEGAGAEYADELTDTFKPALDRALARRREMLGHIEAGEVEAARFRRGWIAYPEYWAAETKETHHDLLEA